MRRMSANTSVWCLRCSALYLVTSIGSESLMRLLSSGSLLHDALTGWTPSCVPE